MAHNWQNKDTKQKPKISIIVICLWTWYKKITTQC